MQLTEDTVTRNVGGEAAIDCVGLELRAGGDMGCEACIPMIGDIGVEVSGGANAMLGWHDAEDTEAYIAEVSRHDDGGDGAWHWGGGWGWGCGWGWGMAYGLVYG